MYLSNFRVSFMMSDLNARYLFNCVFFGVFFQQNSRCLCGLLKLVRRTDYCEPWKEAGITLLHFFLCIWIFQLVRVNPLLIGLLPRLLWAILQPLSPPAKIVNTMNLSKNRIQLFILSSRNFLNSFSKSSLSACFRKSFFSKPTGYVPVFIC